MRFFVSRQSYYYSQKLCVEVSAGGLNYAGADMLGEKYKHLGEGKEFTDPREAVEAAINVCRAWRKDTKSTKPYVSIGYSHGFTAEFDRMTFKHAQEIAEKVYDDLPKCDMCGGLFDDEKKYFYLELSPDEKYCSENCANKAEEEYNKAVEETDFSYQEKW